MTDIWQQREGEMKGIESAGAEKTETLKSLGTKIRHWTNLGCTSLIYCKSYFIETSSPYNLIKFRKKISIYYKTKLFLSNL